MASIEDLAAGSGTIRLVFTRDAPLTLEALQTLVDRRSGALELLEQTHAARTTDLEVCLAGDGFALCQLHLAA